MQAKFPFNPNAEQAAFDVFHESPGSYLLAMSLHPAAEDWDVERLHNPLPADQQQFAQLERELLNFEYKPVLPDTVARQVKRCHKCGSEMSLPGGRQLRSGDEGMTAIYKCTNKNCVKA